jgi:hypothetical protein
MSVLQSTADSLIVAIPMVGLLFAGFFRLDELVGKPKKAMVAHHRLSSWDKDGRAVCVDPDGRIAGSGKRALGD